MHSFINELFDASGEILADFFVRRHIAITQKSNNTPVTEADQMVERALRAMIANRFPDHGIIGEEYGRERDEAEYVWVLDPIDGTIAFIHGVPLFVTLIGLLRNGQPILGGIDQPVARLRCIGDNEVASFNGERTSIRNLSCLDNATMLATDIANVGRLHGRTGFDRLLERVNLFRTWGDGFGYLLIASGRADIMLDAKMAPWDILPVIPVVRGAGARITTFDGKDPVHGDSAICAHPIIHDQILHAFCVKDGLH